jgi:glycosyltransferase involved in cell wall biosynthesis
MKTRIHIDVTAWVRGPRTSIGLCGRELQAALKRILAKDRDTRLMTWTRRLPRESDVANLKKEDAALFQSTDKLGLFASWRGLGGVYHSVDPILSPLKNSVRVLTVHDTWTLWENPYQAPKFQRLQKRKFERALARADHVVVPSEHSREELIKLKPEFKGRVSVIPWGPHITPAPASAPQLETPTPGSVVEAYLAKKRPYFLCVANLEVRKNQDFLLEAMKSLPDVDLVMVGARGYGWEKIEKARQEACATTSCFWFEGVGLEDLRALYRHTLAMVLPSLDEGFGLPACEAIFFDKPLVLSKIVPFYEIAGDSALYFDPVTGLEDLKKILGSLARDEKLRAAWTEKLQSRKHLFSWDLVARAHLALYRKLLKSR